MTAVTAWVAAHWYLVVAAAVLTLGPALVARAWKRGGKAALEATRRRGARVEDVLTLIVASAAAYLSSTGLRAFGSDVMGLGAYEEWLPFVSLDVAALVCGLRARRRARAGHGAGISGTLVWVLIGISAAFSAQEADTLGGSVARLCWPVIAGTLFEIGSLETRKAARDQEKRDAGAWVDRRLAAVRLLHPIEWVRVRSALAADETISQAEATRRVRIDRAGVQLYRLRQVVDATSWYGTGYRWHVDTRAQRAQARVPVSDLPYVLDAARRRTRIRDMAKLAHRSASAAGVALDALLTRTGTNIDPDARQDDDGTDDINTDTGDGTEQVTGGADLSDDELIIHLRGALTPAGTRFTTGGIRSTGRALGIGTNRARRLMERAREEGPLSASGTDPVDPTKPTSAGQADTGTPLPAVAQAA